MSNNLANSNFNDNLTNTSSVNFNAINTNNTNFIGLNSFNDEFIIHPNSTGIHLGSIIINSKNNSLINRLIDQVSVNQYKKMTSIINNEDVNNNLTKFYVDIASSEANNSKTNLNQTQIISQSSSIFNSSSSTSPSSIITLLTNSFHLSSNHSNNHLTTESLPKLSTTKTIPLTELQQTISSNSTQIPLISPTTTMPSPISRINFTNLTASTLTTTTTSLSSSTTTTTLSSSTTTTTLSSPSSTTTLSSIYNINPSEYDDDYISSCFSSPEDYDLFTATICATFLVFGILYMIYGYRCFKSVLFFTGFLFATIVIYLICLAENLMPIYGNIGVSLIAGFLFGLITLLVAYVGLFMLGFHLGLLIAMASLIVIYLTAPFVDWLLVPSSGWILFAIFMTLGLTGACGTLYFQRGKKETRN